MTRRHAFSPFAHRGRRAIWVILLTFGVFSAAAVALSITITARSGHRAAMLQVAARQRTLAERYVRDVLLARSGTRADPAGAAELLKQSATALLNGGEAPAADGDDDETELPPARGAAIRDQLSQAQRLVADLTATGAAILDGRPVTTVKLTADERIETTDPIARLRVLNALTSNVSLNATRTIGADSDRNVGHLIKVQVLFGIAGMLMALAAALALIKAARRQTAHFRSLVTSSTDLVLVFGEAGCVYVSDSVTRALGADEQALLGSGLDDYVHDDDRVALAAAIAHGEPSELVLRVRNRFGEWRQLEAHVTDLRADRNIRGVLLNARDISERVRLEEELTRQAFHDALTGLPNRALFRDRLDHALARSVRTHESLSVLLIDLDGFKQVNDSLGHDAGDQLLRSVAERLDDVVRPTDTLARLGGDEFAVLLEDAGEAEAIGVAQRLLERLAEPLEIAGRELSVGASIGIVGDANDPSVRGDLLRHADVAMYAAKEAGRGRYEVFRREMGRELGELLGIEHELRLALQRGELSLHYQPEIDLATHTIVGVEALLRWHSPTRGNVSPARFIGVAEASGMILALGEYVLNEACAQAARWRNEHVLPDQFVVWVNISGKQLSAGGIDEVVERALQAAGLPADMLGLEVTETAIVEEGASERARAELQALHERGVRIAIDDFGTGFSSLGQLRRFPVDVLKVDRSFVQGVEHDTRDAAIAANLVSLAHALGLVAIAEGIESDGQLNSLRDLGCDLAQGYLFARPAPAAEIGALLAGETQLAR